MKRYLWLSLLIAGLVLAVWGIAVHAQQPARASVREVSPTFEESGPAATGPQVVAPLDTATFYATADAYVYSATPTQTHGSATTLYVGSQTTSDAARALFRFNLASLPTNAIVDSAGFQAYMSSTSSIPPVLSVGAYRINTEWAEHAVHWANQPPAVPIGKVTGVSMTLQYYDWDVTDLAQAWVANPASNFGLELRSETEGTVGWRGFASREAVPAIRPQLVIEYHLPACTDLQEPNDTFAQAFPITPAVEYLGCIPTPSDLDYFRFDVAPHTAISVELYNLPANYDLYLYDPAQALLDSSTNAGTTSEVVEYTNESTSGPFYAKVQSGGEWDFYDSYALKLTLTPVTVWPDLVINDVWSVGSQVCYEIENIGQATALQGHQTSLTVDGIIGPNQIVATDLAPGEKAQGCFAYSYQCTLPQDTLTICADYEDDVDESDESNNCLQEIWSCDTSPPIIIIGPTVSNITSIGATISWTTDEASDSAVRFGRKAGMFEGEETDSALTQAHAVVLSGLQPAATYRYVVRSTDAAGNTVASRELFFKTGPPASGPPPSISEVTLTRISDKPIYYNIAASVPTGADVERVEFTIDGELLGKAYSPQPGAPGLYEFPLIPALFDISREEFFADHTIEGIAVGYGGLTGHFPVQFSPPYTCADIHLEMNYPYTGTTLYFDDGALPPGTSVPISVYAWRLEDRDCRYVVCDPHDDPGCLFQCEYEEQSIERIDFAVRGAQVCTFPGHFPPETVYTCDWDAGGLGAGVYGIRVDVIANEECKKTLFRDVTVERGEPRLNVNRVVTRHGNYFEVALTVENQGRASMVVDRLEDNLAGFQPISKTSALPPYQVTANCRHLATTCDIDIDISGDVGGWAETLEPGESLVLSYLVVPVLYPEADDVDHAIGDEPIIVHVVADPSEQSFDRPCVTVAGGTALANAVYSATVESDYLIVTHPFRLYALFSDDDVDSLLVTMAELAQRKNGILGYLTGDDYSDEEAVRDMILEWGRDMRGSDGVAGNYLENGYLLIVGETEVVASHQVSDRGIRNATDNPDVWRSGPVDPVRLVDNYYADTDSGTKPELIVGRIIGNDAASLRIPIEMGWLDAFDCSSALVVSGLDSNADKQESFIANANAISATLVDKFSVVDVEHWSDYDTVTDALSSFVFAVQARDAIIYSNHGGRRSWSSVLGTGDFPLDFLGSHPLVAAFACNTGYYQGINSIADKFLDSQAGGYIGSTELAHRPTTLEAGLIFVDRWPGEGISAGAALKSTKRALLAGDESAYERLWALENNLYGDPKYGLCPAVEAAVETSDVQYTAVSPSVLEVTVPDYQVTSSNGLDTARIPGGLMLLEPGLPMVPVYVVIQDYPAGHEVQHVLLAARSGMTTATGLHLPLVGDDPTGAGESDLTWSAQSAPDWYPEQDYDWEIDRRLDGGSTVVIRLCPFYYNASTTDVQFYKNYSFDIQTITSTLEIAALTTDRHTYAQGEVVQVGLWVTNTGALQDVVVSIAVESEGLGEAVDGLLLRTLQDVESLAFFSHQWDSTGYAPGYYTVKAELRDETGSVLARADESFRVGIAAGAITTFTVTPTLFDIGAQVAVSLTFANTGTVPLTGTAIVQIQTEAGEVVQEFSHDYGDLAPGNDVTFADAWGTSGAANGSYRVIAYVLYESTATEPRAIIVRTRRSLYLPLILRSSE